MAMLLRDSADPDSLTACRDSAPRNAARNGQVSQLSDTKASLLSHQARPSTVQHYRSTCFNMVPTWYKLASLCNLEVLKQSKQSSCFAPCADFLAAASAAQSKPFSAFSAPSRAQDPQDALDRLSFEMWGDVRRYETVVMIWNDMKRRWNHHWIHW